MVCISICCYHNFDCSLQLCYLGLESHGPVLLRLSRSPPELDRHGGHDLVRPADDADHAERHHRLLRGILLWENSSHQGAAFNDTALTAYNIIIDCLQLSPKKTVEGFVGGGFLTGNLIFKLV